MAVRFWSRVAHLSDNECWLWLGKTRGGYGRIMIDKKYKAAHRVALELRDGALPSDLDVLHKCDVRACVNPNHLVLGTHLDNMRDMVAKGRRPDTHGARNPKAKLTESDVSNIRARHETQTLRQIAEAYGVTEQCIYRIVTHRSWRHTATP